MPDSNNLLFNHAATIQVALFAILITSIWVLEVIFCVETVSAKWKHSATNMLFILSALPVQLFLTFFVVAISKWANFHHWGIVNLIPFHNHTLLYYTISFFILDLFEYIYHVIMHKTKALWKFHIVHHTDLEVDVSTTVREHPGETCIRVCFLMLWVFISGISIGVLVLRQTVQTVANIFAHSKIRLPYKIEKVLGAVFITPNLHHVHHHYQLPFTDSNYGDVFSIWDRIFGTFKELEIEETVFGIDTHFDETICENYINITKIPFKKFKT